MKPRKMWAGPPDITHFSMMLRQYKTFKDRTPWLVLPAAPDEVAKLREKIENVFFDNPSEWTTSDDPQLSTELVTKILAAIGLTTKKRKAKK